jgi:hypothetical protein
MNEQYGVFDIKPENKSKEICDILKCQKHYDYKIQNMEVNICFSHYYRISHGARLSEKALSILREREDARTPPIPFNVTGKTYIYRETSNIWSVRGFGVKKIEFENYLDSRIEIWTDKQLSPRLKKEKSYKKNGEYIAYVTFPFDVNFSSI